MRSLLAFIFVLIGFSSEAQEYFLIVGTYDSPKSEGIYVYTFNSANGTASVQPVSHIRTSNPSFLAISPNEKYVYAVNETSDSTGKGGTISSFSFNKKTKSLNFLSRQSSEGNSPCYVAVDRNDRSVIAANYSTGNICVLPVSKGKLGQSIQSIQFTGSGPDTSRQKSPHAHGIFFSKDYYRVYVTDLGTDRIMNFYRDSKTGKLYSSKSDAIKMEPGSGPRHMAFHPGRNFIYVLEELNSNIAVLKDLGNAEMSQIQSISAFPPYIRGPIGGSADIHISPDGKFLYTSTRGFANSIGIYSIDQQTGMLTPVDHISSGGDRPRNFNFDPSGKFLLVANQNSDEIVIFKRELTTGKLTDTGNRIKVGKPVCLKWINTL